MQVKSIKRAKVIAALLEDGDPVLRRGIPASVWRGGVVRCEGHRVLVTQVDQSQKWFDEAELVHADARPALPTRPRGRIPSWSTPSPVPFETPVGADDALTQGAQVSAWPSAVTAGP